MRILFIWPSTFETTMSIPLVFAYLVNQIDKEKHQVNILDCALNKIPANSKRFIQEIENFNPDIVGVSCWSDTTIVNEVLEVVKQVKNINSKIHTVVGGVHANLYPEYMIKFDEIDYLITGEADFSFPKLVHELEQKERDFTQIKGLVYLDKKQNVRINERERIEDLDKLEIPDYNFINFKKYLKQGYRLRTPERLNAPIWSSRGCPYNCGYCCVPGQSGNIFREHSVDYLVKWIKFLRDEYDIKYFNIVDDTFTTDMERAKTFFRRVIDEKLNIGIGLPRGVRMQKTDKEMFRLMKEAGLVEVTIAPESGSNKVLKLMNKEFDASWTMPKVREIREAGLKIFANFIVGYPGETKEDLEMTIKLLREMRPDFFYMNNFQPYPGTPVHQDLVQNGSISAESLPVHMTKGDRVYTPEVLKGVNFSKLVLREYLYNFLRNPSHFIYLLRVYDLKLLTKLFLNNFIKTFKRRYESGK